MKPTRTTLVEIPQTKGLNMRIQLAVLGIWIATYIAILMIAMFLTAVGLNIPR